MHSFQSARIEGSGSSVAPRVMAAFYGELNGLIATVEALRDRSLNLANDLIGEEPAADPCSKFPTGEYQLGGRCAEVFDALVALKRRVDDVHYQLTRLERL